MTIDAFWNELCKKNPKLANESATAVFRVPELRKLLEQCSRVVDKPVEQEAQGDRLWNTLFGGFRK